MARVLIYFFLIFTLAGAHGAKDPEEDFRKLPKLFHLDDFERCLERKDGVYCLGQFEVYSEVHPNPLFDLIQEKSQDERLYNRTYLHRGYCLPTRCPGGEANATARFERCVDAWARGHSLRARIHTLHYCRAHGEPRPKASDTNDLPHRVLLYFVCTMLIMAGIGTIYDLNFAEKGSKNPLLMSFSLRENYKTLTSSYQDADPRLKDLEVLSGMKCYAVIGFIICHVYVLTSATYQHNPRFMEKILNGTSGFMIAAIMPTTTNFVVMSNFLMTYNLLLMAEKINVNLKFYGFLLLKRIIRMYPAYLLVNGFAATWWRSFGDGPMWPVLVANESEICKKKFWITAAFLQNFIYKKELCLAQTWVIAVDMQLHLFTLFLTLILIKYQQHAIKVLSVLLVAAMAFVAYQVFAMDLISTYVYLTPEVARTLFKEVDSFFDLYASPLSGLISAIAGIMLAFLHYDHQNRGIKMSRSKVLVNMQRIVGPLIFVWCYLSCVYFRYYDRKTQNLMAFVERVVCCSIGSYQLYSYVNHKNHIHKLLSWTPLRVMAKLTLSISMCHWTINSILVSNRWTLHESSVQTLITDVILVHVLAHVVALLLTLLVEYPLHNFLDTCLNKTGLRLFPKKKPKAM